MNPKFSRSLLRAASVGLLLAAACVDHRPIRNGLRNESVYLDKAALTAPNPKLGPDSTDDGWLFRTTVVAASSPNILGDYAWPGYESDTKYVKFRFREDTLQILDGRKLQKDDADDPNDDLPTSTERVMLEFAGQHVDVKLRESLDGERTNFLEENTEEDWQKRQKFRVDVEKSSLDPVSVMAWYYGQYVHDCSRMVSANMVPGSFEYDTEDQSMSWVVEVNYEVNLLTYFGDCTDLVSVANGVNTTTIQYRMSFYRPNPSNYVPQVIAEKDEVNKKYGSFQDMEIFRDEETGLLSARSLLHRWNPDREEPVVFYFIKGFPERFKPMFKAIKEETNRVLESAGAKLRVDFLEYNHDGVERNFGDIRYSFVVWHQDIDTTRGLLGYGPSGSDPRTGEIISANLNLYNVGMDYYRFLIQDYLEEFGGLKKPDATKKWEEIQCAPGTTVAPVDQTQRLKSTLFSEMRRVMELPEATPDSIAVDDFLPTPARGEEAFLADYHRVLGELRYVNPAYNSYVYMPSERRTINDLSNRMKTEREFNAAMADIMLNRNPFEGVGLSTREGIEKQNEFLRNFRKWRKNHDLLTAEKEMLLGMKNISTFDANDAISAISKGARRCTAEGVWESDEQYQERIIEDVVFQVAIHEFGHNLSLRHNFYGSVDAKHMEPGETSSSVMDYVSSFEETGTPRTWGAYDIAALSWIYGDEEVRARVMKEDFLYCTDEHRANSALCTAHDLGITPSQIVLNAIERYDWLYSVRNRRAYRTFWDTGAYGSGVYNAVFPLQRMWYLALFDWSGGGIEDTLKRLDQVNGGKVLTDQEYNEIGADFANDVNRAIELTIAFYDAVINQPASFRNYQTEFDPYYGDVIRMGIILDKLYTTYAFMDLQEVYNYSPNVNTYVSLYDSPVGNRNLALSQRVLDNMLGAGYDTFPWFRFSALNIFANVTNTNLVDSAQLKERIAIQRFLNREDFELRYGAAALAQANREDNPAGLFVHNGEEYVYTFLPDRGWHLVASRSRSPVSYQFVKEYNETLRAEADDDEDNYALKILLAYYEFYNNFSGF